MPRLTVRVLPSISYVPEAVMFIPASYPKTTQVSRSIARAVVMLLNQPGEMVSREDLRKVLWPNDTVVEFEHSINAAVQRLRDALGDSAGNRTAGSGRARRRRRMPHLH